jgi:hypothetical protein
MTYDLTFCILVFSLLIDIKEQLNNLQFDVSELKRKMTDLEEKTDSKLRKIDATGTAMAFKLDKVDKTFTSIQNVLVQRGLGKALLKPSDFPATIFHDTFQDLERFDDLLHDFDDCYALYYVSFYTKFSLFSFHTNPFCRLK